VTTNIEMAQIIVSALYGIPKTERVLLPHHKRHAAKLARSKRFDLQANYERALLILKEQ